MLMGKMMTFLSSKEPMSGKGCVLFKVMLVEDDEGFRRSLAGLLMSRFPSIAIGEARDGAEAMEKMESFLPNLIFMDIKLPGRSGLDVLRSLRARGFERGGVAGARPNFRSHRNPGRHP